MDTVSIFYGKTSLEEADVQVTRGWHGMCFSIGDLAAMAAAWSGKSRMSLASQAGICFIEHACEQHDSASSNTDNGCQKGGFAALNTVLSIEHLSVEYRSRDIGQRARLAVNGLNLSVAQGEVFGFLGPNGAGKTTTMNVLLGLRERDQRHGAHFGVDVRETIARQRIGYLPELTYYYKFLTAEELLRFYAKLFRHAPARDRKAH